MLFVALLVLGATLHGVNATTITTWQHSVQHYNVLVNGNHVSVAVKNGIVTVPETPGMDRRTVIMAVNRYFSGLHRQSAVGIPKGYERKSITKFYGPNFDYEERKAFSIPHQGDVYISSYASLNITKDEFSVVGVGGYSSAACWIQPYDYWWSQDYIAQTIGIGVSLKFVAFAGSVSVSIPPGVGFYGTSDGAGYTATLHNEDYIGVDFSGIEAAATLGIWEVKDHTDGSFYFGKVGGNTFYVQGANLYKVRGQNQ
ncbi:hypothetical protein [Thermococcus sp.]